jgi:NADH-quinone oxidoreductase subunit N
MSPAGVKALMPLLIIAGTAVLAMLGVAIRRRHRVTAGLAFAGLAAAFASLWVAAGSAPRVVPPLFTIDRYALFYMGLIFAASMVFVLLSYDYFSKCEGDHDELYVLMLVATLGASVLVASTHLISLFLGLELLSVPLYVMVSYPRTRPLPLEAGLKYLVLAAASAAFLLFGVALIYAAVGTMELPQLASALSIGAPHDRRLILSGMVLVVTGMGFKLAVVPFHLWTPDVYEGAPAPVTAYIASVSKGATLAVLLRVFHASQVLAIPSVLNVFWVIALASMLAGNLLALLQPNIKRMLAYSSIAHLGYALVAFQAGGDLGPAAVTFYLAAYFVTILGAFGVISLLSNGERECVLIEDYRGLFWRRPGVAAIFTAMLFSLAGIPLTAGFIGKFYVVAAGASSAMWSLLIVLAITSAIGLYYYLRVVVAMYGRVEKHYEPEPRLRPIPNLLLTGLTGLLLWLGMLPGTFLRLIRDAVGGLT